MAGENELVIKISGDVGDYKAALELAKEGTEELSESLKKTTEYAAVAFAALTVEVYASVKSFHEHAVAVNEVTNALQNQGIYSADLAANYRDIAKAISEKTAIDDDQIMSAMAQGQALMGNKKITEELTKAVVDFSVGAKIGLSEAFTVVGKAVAGNTMMLQRYGIHISDAVTSSERLRETTEKLTTRYGDAAEIAAKTAGGTQGLKVAFDDMQKVIGEKLAPAFDRVKEGFIAVFNFVEKHPEVAELTANVILAGTAITGLAVALGTAALAFMQIRAAIIAMGLAAEASSVGVRLLVGATGLGLLIVVAAEILAHWETVFPALQAIWKGFSVTIIQGAAALAKVLHGVFHLDPAEIKAGVAEAVKAFNDGVAAAKKSDVYGPPSSAKGDNGQIAAKAEAAKKEQDLEAYYENLKRQRIAAQNQLLLMQDQQYTKDSVELKKQEIQLLTEMENQKNAALLGSLKKRLADVRSQEKTQAEIEKQQNEELNNDLLKSNAGYQSMDAAQRQAFLKKNGAAMKQELTVERNAKEAYAKQEFEQQKKLHNTMLIEQQKYGTAYATINMAMHSAVYEGSKSAFGELAALQQSSNSTLKSIGKIAAVANIVIKTAESAMNIFAGFSTIPIIGPALGVAGAAAAVAFGAEQIGTVTSAAQGGLLEGGIPGVDSIPVLAMAGEVVTPRQNFEEVVGSVAAKRAAESQGFASGGGSDPEMIALLQSIDSKVGGGGSNVTINGDALGDPVWIQQLVKRISDALEFQHAKIFGVNVGVAT